MAGRIKCRSAQVISSGIDAALAADLHKIATRDGIYLLGPNSLGFQRQHLQLNASVAGELASQGPLALVSQSGALTAAMLDWARKNAVGFSTVVSLGPNTAVDMAQVLDFLASDAKTHSIVIYMEGITNARRFMSALRAAANAKPVVVLKAGRKPASNQAVLTHSGAIVGSDDVFDAALRRAGAVRVRSFVGLFSAAKCLASRYKPVGKRLAIVTNGGGPGVLAADWVSEINLTLGQLTPEQALAIKPQMPPLATLTDLIDVSEEAGPEHFRLAIEAVSKAPQIDGILVIYSPKMGSDGDAVASAMANFNRQVSKPLLTCWMGDATVGDARKILNDAAIPTFRTPEAAVGAFGNIASFYQNQQLLQQTPPPLSDLAKPDVQGARDEQGLFVAYLDKTGNATAWGGIHCQRTVGAGNDDKRGKLDKSLAMNIKRRELFFDDALFGGGVDGAELRLSFNVHGGSPSNQTTCKWCVTSLKSGSSGKDLTTKPSPFMSLSMLGLLASTRPSISVRPFSRAKSMIDSISREPRPRPLNSSATTSENSQVARSGLVM
jgi:acyl-CoA synthetase (NDP forming)